MSRPFTTLAVAALAGLATSQDPAAEAASPTWHSPHALTISHDGARAYVVDTTANEVVVLDVPARGVLHRVAVGAHPVGAELAVDGRELFVACRHAHRIDVVDLDTARVTRSFEMAFEPYGLCAAADGRRLYVTQSVGDSVLCLRTDDGGPVWECAVGSDPRSIVAFDAGRRLLVANGLSREVTILDAVRGDVLEARAIGQASLLRGLCLDRDERFAFVAHVLSRDPQMTLQMERGWIHSNGFSVVDLDRPGHYVTLLLDRILVGAANPWGVARSPDGGRLYITIAGTHEVALVDVDAALRLVAETDDADVEQLARNVEVLERERIARFVPSGGLGPRGVAVSPATGEVLVANYFSEDVAILDGESGELRGLVPLAPRRELTLERRGELLFNDARLCFQRWFSCASCHQEDATVDGLNWDLVNDGLGNPKNAKSMHDVHDTPPAMWSGVRSDMDAAVAAGQRFLGFLPEPDNHLALMAYIGAARRAPNPYLRLEDPARLARGAAAFRKANCARCHPPPTYTDNRRHRAFDPAPTDLRSRFVTPSLRECYRTAPFLHDGRAATLRDVLEIPDPRHRHGRVARLTPEELDDLLAFLRSL